MSSVRNEHWAHCLLFPFMASLEQTSIHCHCMPQVSDHVSSLRKVPATALAVVMLRTQKTLAPLMRSLQDDLKELRKAESPVRDQACRAARQEILDSEKLHLGGSGSAHSQGAVPRMAGDDPGGRDLLRNAAA